jgi:hypothetical protein
VRLALRSPGVTVASTLLPFSSRSSFDCSLALLYGSLCFTRAKTLRLPGALSTFSTLGNSRMAASTITKASPAGKGISICRRWRFARALVSALLAMRRTRCTWENAMPSAQPTVARAATRNIHVCPLPMMEAQRMTPRRNASAQARVIRATKSDDFMAQG